MPQKIDIDTALNTVQTKLDRAYAGASRTFVSVDSNTSIRSEFGNPDFEYYRKSSRIPKDNKKRMQMSMDAYDNVPIVHNVVDLMSDFGVQGFRFKHETKSVERMLNTWLEYVGGYFVSERILNMLYRTSNVPIYRQTGKIPVKIVSDWKSKTRAQGASEFDEPKVARREIPTNYTILNPLSIDVIGGNLSALTHDPQYILQVPALVNTSASMIFRKDDLAKIIEDLPDDIREAFKTQQPYMYLDKDKFQMLFYKKDDWQAFATPMLSSLLEPLMMLEKMHLADRAALDGAISQVRLWKLGIIDTANPQNSLIPSPAAIQKLIELLSRTNNGPIDIVWPADIDFKESDTKVHLFLGQGKYVQVMSEIYGGLGVPASLTGDNTSGGGGFTNNSISMNTLIERLKYGRHVLTSFWIGEAKRLQQAIGFSKLPSVVFDFMNLGDPTAFYNLLLGMADRNIISNEELRNRVDIPNDIEIAKIIKEEEERESGEMPPKAGPYHNAENANDMKKLFVQKGVVAPSQMGINIPDKKDGESIPLELEEKHRPKPATVPGRKPQSGKNGRPSGKKDSTKRKSPTVKPRGSASFLNNLMFATAAQDTIQEMLLPGLKPIFGVDNLRQMSAANKQQFENMKLLILSQLEPFEEVTKERVYQIVSNGQKTVCENLKGYVGTYLNDFFSKHARNPTTEEMKSIYAYAYATDNEREDEC